MTTIAITPARARSLGRVKGWIGAVGSGIGAAGDGLIVGLSIGFVVFTAASAPTTFLGLPDALAVAIVGGVTVAIAVIAATAAIVVRRAVHGLTEVATTSGVLAARPRARAIVAVPDRVLHGLPVAWVGAFAAFLWIVLVGRAAYAPIAILTPAGSTVPYLYLGGIIGATLGVARHLALVRPGAATPGRWRRRTSVALVLVAGGLLVAGGSVAWWPGDAARMAAPDPAYDGRLVATSLPDPGAPGDYVIERLTYGSGTDARRAAFGRDADLITDPVDASRRLAPLAPGADAARTWFWGFDTRSVPIQGLAWLPAGDGPFPLVLIVHGNHAMGDFSESGYAYLGEHLASRGFVVASIDEDFLNGSWADDYLGNEQLVRAWILLLHLDAWRAWTAEDGPLAGRVDLDHVALIGHSRGGEAASAAAMLAGSPNPPPAGLTPWPTGLDVDAVVSIAPSDGQYGSALVLDGVDFLTLQGGWDADARAWSGIRQYARTTPDPDGFAAGMWVYRANHGQFNTVWGAADFGPFSPAVLDLAPLLSAEEQRDVAKTAIAAFLTASLGGDDGYRGLFQRPMIGRDWLPDDIIIVRSKAGTDRSLVDRAPDRPIDGSSIATWGGEAHTAFVPLRALQPDQGLRGTLLRWSSGAGVASWSIEGLERTTATGTAPTAVRISLADGRAVGPAMDPLAIDVRVVAGDTSVSLPLAQFGALPPPLPVQLAKHDLLAGVSGLDLSLRTSNEVVLQTYEIPLTAVVDVAPAFDPGRLSAIGIEVPRVADGALWIAEPALVP